MPWEGSATITVVEAPSATWSLTVSLVAAPYLLWANRRRATMRVWIPRTPED